MLRIEAQRAVVVRNGARFVAEVVEGLGKVKPQDGVACKVASESAEQRQRRCRARRVTDLQRLRDSLRFVPIFGRKAR